MGNISCSGKCARLLVWLALHRGLLQTRYSQEMIRHPFSQPSVAISRQAEVCMVDADAAFRKQAWFGWALPRCHKNLIEQPLRSGACWTLDAMLNLVGRAWMPTGIMDLLLQNWKVVTNSFHICYWTGTSWIEWHELGLGFKGGGGKPVCSPWETA